MSARKQRKSSSRSPTKKPATKKRTRKPGETRGRKPVDGVQSFALTPVPLELEGLEPAQRRALSAYLETGTVSAACHAASVGRRTWYDWLQRDARFAELVAEADTQVLEGLEAFAHKIAPKLAAEGTVALLIWLLKCRMRSKYGDKQVVTIASPELQAALAKQAHVIGSRPTWDSQELYQVLHDEVWK